ncbi:MAG TPA: hypothetical protein VFP44_18795 [Usitatibacter sp.]|nr:hypothetical protein [Usitatibacter sp.]
MELKDQERYARVLSWGSHIGLAVLVAFFAIYILEVVPPLVPHERLPELWSAPSSEFLRGAGVEPGWDWMRLLHHADVLNLLGIAILALCSVPPIAAIMPLYWASHRRAIFAICALELVVILVAASGLLIAH